MCWRIYTYICTGIYDTKHTYVHIICIVCLFIDTIERENHLNFKHVHIRTERIHTQLLRLLQKHKQKLKHTSFKLHDDHLWFHQQADRLLFCEFLTVLFIIITSSFHRPI